MTLAAIANQGPEPMFALTTRTHVTGLSGREITDFLSTCDDAAFRRWWPDVHFHMHTIKGRPGDIGSVIHMDELIGTRRLRARVEVMELDPGRSIVWQVRRPLFRLPVRLVLKFDDDGAGVSIEQSIVAGLPGAGAILDPLFRLVFPPRFAAAKDEHVRTEFVRLRDLLHAGAA